MSNGSHSRSKSRERKESKPAPKKKGIYNSEGILLGYADDDGNMTSGVNESSLAKDVQGWSCRKQFHLFVSHTCKNPQQSDVKQKEIQ